MDVATSLPVFCEICGQECETTDSVLRHMQEEHGRRGSTCPFCDLAHINVDQLNFHVNTAHADILSPLRSESPTEPYLLVETNTSEPGGRPHVIDVSPRQFDRGGGSQLNRLTPDRGFRSPKDGQSSSAWMDSEDDEVEIKETVKMEVFYNSNDSLLSSSNRTESSEGGSASGYAEESPLRRVIGNLSPLRWSQRKNKNKVLKDVKGLWSDVPSTSGSDESLKPEGSQSQWHEHLVNGKIDMTSRGATAATSCQGGASPTKPKETLLEISKQATLIDEPVLCPICGLGDYDAAVIQRHVEVEHSEASHGDQVLGANGLNLGDSGMITEGRGIQEAAANKRELVHDSNSNVLGYSKRSCPVCHAEGLPEDKIDEHVNSHFESSPTPAADQSRETYDRHVAEQMQEQEKELQKQREEEHFKLLKQQYGMDEKGSYQKQAETNLDRAMARGNIGIADYYDQKIKLSRQQSTGEEDSKYRIPGVIGALCRFYHGNVHNVLHARLAGQTDHFASSPGCKGWGCGYRNLQMLLSAMWHDPGYREVVFNGKNAVPSISYIQRLIEGAWRKGFDPAGMEQLGNRLVNTRKWIGATEITALLHSLKVKCSLVDFHKSTGPGGTHPRMFEWVRDYFGKPPIFGGFGGKDEAIISKKMPLYLQHQGHSRSIVGCEVMKDGSIRLLLFDPSTKPNDMAVLRSGNVTGAALRPLRKTMGQMKHKQYQIVAVTGLIASDKEYEESKLLVSVLIP